MIIIEILLAVGVLGIIGLAFYAGYQIGKANDEINRDSDTTK